MDTPQIPKNVTQQEYATTTRVLKAFAEQNTGFLPLELFSAITSLVTTPTIDVVPLIIKDSGIHIACVKRPENHAWPGQWHTPGSVYRSTDAPGFDTTIARALSELGSPRVISGPHMFNIIGEHRLRGTEFSMQMWCVIEDIADDSAFDGVVARIDDLPQPFIESQLPMLQQAVKAYQTHQKTSQS